MSVCKTLQDRMADEGAGFLDWDTAAQSHVSSCPECQKVKDDLENLDRTLDALGRPDAPEEIVGRTLAAVQAAPAPVKPSRGVPFNARSGWAAAMAACLVLAAAYTLSRDHLTENARDRLLVAEGPQAKTEGGGFAFSPESEESLYDGRISGGAQSHAEDASGFSGRRQNEPRDQLTPARNEQAPAELSGSRIAQEGKKQKETSLFRSYESAPAGPADLYDEDLPADPMDVPATGGGRESEILRQLQLSAPEGDLLMEESQPFAKQDRVSSDLGNTELAASGLESFEQEARRRVKDRPARAFGDDSPDPDAADKKSLRRDGERPAAPAALDGNAVASQKEAVDPARLLARSYLAARASTAGLQFQEAQGYWSNSYRPGDPDMRLLEARLRKWHETLPASAAAPEESVRPVPQPFDAPEGAAMALYLQTDKAALQGAGRVTLQVGLKAADVTAGHRPAMALALVVDLRDSLNPEELRRLRALLDALSRARRPGDRFSLHASGPGGGLLVGPNDFRHGPLRVAFERIVDRGTGRGIAGEALGIAPALRQAADHLRAVEEAGEPRGASLLLLAGSRLAMQELPQLEELAYRQALDGLPLSFVALASDISQDALDRLVAAGQGNRRYLLEPAEAPALVERELQAAARATARALRLNIRLAPGVKLIGIANSHRLAEPQADKLRATEQAIDRRLAENLGIAADRGEDDEAIQIVIPNFYAGDDHVILLDLLVDGPGPLAEVTLRYKDLRRLTNGTARASLALANGRESAGPLEWNVFKNRLAADFSQRLRGVARLLATGQAQAAATALARMRDLLRGLRLERPALAQDPDLLADEALLERYLDALARGGVMADPQMLAGSLRYSAWRKQQSALP